MLEIYSKVDETLLHIVYRKSDFKGRQDIVNPLNFIQVASLVLKEGQTFKPHKHLWKPGPQEVIAQESWVVISGIIRAIYYDLNDEILTTQKLYPGDISVTLKGGHNYFCESDALVYEFKTGPYTGQENDKQFI